MQTSSPQIPDSTKNPHRERRDIVDALRAAGVAPQKLMELDQGRALAQWQNRKGEVRYERPRHHALSIYINEGDKARRVVNGRAVSQGFLFACFPPAVNPPGRSTANSNSSTSTSMTWTSPAAQNRPGTASLTGLNSVSDTTRRTRFWPRRASYWH